MTENDKRIICSSCKMVVIGVVPLVDSDQNHKGKMVCVDCKRKIKKGEKIIKFDRRASISGW